MMTTEFCPHKHTVRVTWGVASRQTTECCAECAKLIFEQAKPQIAAGVLPYTIQDIEDK